MVSVLPFVGLDKIAVSSAETLTKKHPSTRIDLSSIAQGYTVERLAWLLVSFNITNYLVEIGGELQASGRKPDGQVWRIGIERPTPGGRKLHKTIAINTQVPTVVMTSGTYRHFFDENGKRYSHIIDGRSGRPVEHNTVSVTVMGEDASSLDAWSTALLCLGAKHGVEVAAEHGVAALFFVDEVDGLKEISSPQWEEMHRR